MATAGSSWVGVRVERFPVQRAARCALAIVALARRLMAQGFVIADLRDSNGPRRIASGCHVAFVVVDCRSARAAAGALLPLARASPRGHLVIDLRFRPPRRSDTTRSAWRAARASHDATAARAEAWTTQGRFDVAEALLSACSAAAFLLRVPVSQVVLRARFWLRFWQGRFEEARRELSAIRARHHTDSLWHLLEWAEGAPARTERQCDLRVGDWHAPWIRRLWACQRAVLRGSGSPVRVLGSEALWAGAPPLFALAAARLRASQSCSELDAADRLRRRTIPGAHGVGRWGMETHMRLLHAIPDLLTVLSREDDEGRVLAGGCRWAADHTGAEVGFVDASHGVILAAQPPGLPGLTVEERQAVVGRDRPHLASRFSDVIVSSPVRYAGAIAGHVVCIGMPERAETMAEAAGHLAALCAPAVRARMEVVDARAQSSTRIPDILGRSPGIAMLREAVVRAAQSAFSVVIEGESGSGKELVARAIHRLSARRDRRFAALNCAALTDELAETELFGHTRGAFTGAVGARTGLFEEAHLGTLFLDEVAELSPRTQAKLLRAIQEREVRRLGENGSRPVDVRIVTATNRSLHGMAAEGLFREDLLFRLAVIRIRVPPLRDRAEDIALLAVTAWKQLTHDLPTRAWLGPDALARLAQHTWPGNVRELQNIMAAIAVNAPVRGRISARHVTRALEDMGGATQVASRSLIDARLDCERLTVTSALARHGGRRAAAARELGLSRQGLAKAIKRLHIADRPIAEGVA